jgi:hypothetical protein
MHGVSFSLPDARSDRVVSLLLLRLYLYRDWFWFGDGNSAAPRLLAWVGYTPLSFFGLILRNSSFSDAMVPSYKRGGEGGYTCSFYLLCSLHLKLGFWVAIPFDTTVFTRPRTVSAGLFFF